MQSLGQYIFRTQYPFTWFVRWCCLFGISPPARGVCCRGFPLLVYHQPGLTGVLATQFQGYRTLREYLIDPSCNSHLPKAVFTICYSLPQESIKPGDCLPSPCCHIACKIKGDGSDGYGSPNLRHVERNVERTSEVRHGHTCAPGLPK